MSWTEVANKSESFSEKSNSLALGYIDNFNGSSLDLTKWTENFVGSPLSVNGGYAKFTIDGVNYGRIYRDQNVDLSSGIKMFRFKMKLEQIQAFGIECTNFWFGFGNQDLGGNTTDFNVAFVWSAHPLFTNPQIRYSAEGSSSFTTIELTGWNLAEGDEVEVIFKQDGTTTYYQVFKNSIEMVNSSVTTYSYGNNNGKLSIFYSNIGLCKYWVDVYQDGDVIQWADKDNKDESYTEVTNS